MSRLLERNIEEKVRKAVLKLSTADRPVLFWKLSALGIRGIPDRLMLWAPGRVLFIEFKAPNEKPRKLQEFIHAALRRMGFDVEVFDDADEAMANIQARIFPEDLSN